jgi:methylated-DNA-[protein]-cysteine S-methyltransferase
MIQNTIFTTILKTPIKEMFVAMFNDELIIFTPYEKEFCTKKLNQFKKILGVDFIIEDDDKFIYFKEELKKYFSKKSNKINIPIKLLGTNFQIKVWETLLKIPYGETISYKEEAFLINNPKGYRAVANANGKNNLNIIVPCHRVISNDGSIGGYTGGIEIKEFLLKLEGVDI